MDGGACQGHGASFVSIGVSFTKEDVAGLVLQVRATYDLQKRTIWHFRIGQFTRLGDQLLEVESHV